MAAAPTLYSRSHQRRESSQRMLKPLLGGELVLDFLNTSDRSHGNPGSDELAPGYVNVVAWFQHAGVLEDEESQRLLRLAQKDPREAAAVRRRATALREALVEIVAALISGREPATETMRAFAEEVHRSQASGHYLAKDGRLAWEWIQPVCLDRILWEVCLSATTLLGSDKVGRIKQCASDACEVLFLDTSKNRSRQFCSTSGCGTATRVRRYRERHRQPG